MEIHGAAATTTQRRAAVTAREAGSDHGRNSSQKAVTERARSGGEAAQSPHFACSKIAVHAHRNPKTVMRSSGGRGRSSSRATSPEDSGLTCTYVQRPQSYAPVRGVVCGGVVYARGAFFTARRFDQSPGKRRRSIAHSRTIRWGSRSWRRASRRRLHSHR